MKVRSPYDRNDLDIKKSDYVLEVGPGHNPSFRSNVILEKFVDSNYHRCGDVKIYPHQKFVNAPGESLPFADKEFDYVICNQVLEHSDNPETFLREQSRVAGRGYIETPSLLGEFLFPKKSHRWVILDIDGKLVLYEKSKMPGDYGNNYGELFLNYLPYQSLPYKLLWFTEGDIMINRYEWKGGIDFVVNPTEERYLRFFTQPWDKDMVRELFPPRTMGTEAVRTWKALRHLMRERRVRSKQARNQPLTLEEHIENNRA